MRRLLALPVQAAASTTHVAAFWLEAFGVALAGHAPVDEVIRHRAGSVTS